MTTVLHIDCREARVEVGQLGIFAKIQAREDGSLSQAENSGDAEKVHFWIRSRGGTNRTCWMTGGCERGV